MEQRQHAGDSSPTLSTSSRENEKKGSLPQWMSSIVPSTLQSRWPPQSSNAAPRPFDRNQTYLTGVRGVLVPMAFLWTFLQTFAPTAVKGNSNTTGPSYQIAFGKSLSVLFWNNTLIYSSIIFLSARTICLPFLLEPTKTVLASSVFRRGLRLWFPVAAALIVVYFVFTHSLGNQYLEDFCTLTGNTSLVPGLYLIPTSLANFNAIFEIFWVSHIFQSQAGNWAFPTQMLWVVSVLFQQSYTVYMTMVIIPYTRQRWRVIGAIGFILTAWWVYSWAFYSIAGLLIADAVMNMDLRPGGSTSFSILGFRIPIWLLGLFAFLAGFALQFTWVAALPQYENAELYYHTGLYSTGGINYGVDTAAAQMRADCWLIVVGFSLLLETSSVLQTIFRSRFLVFLGKRSFCKPSPLWSNTLPFSTLLIAHSLLPPPTHHHLHPRHQSRDEHDGRRHVGLPQSNGRGVHCFAAGDDPSSGDPVLVGGQAVAVVWAILVRLDTRLRRYMYIHIDNTPIAAQAIIW